jgi:hypothetical protein
LIKEYQGIQKESNKNNIPWITAMIKENPTTMTLEISFGTRHNYETFRLAYPFIGVKDKKTKKL